MRIVVVASLIGSFLWLFGSLLFNSQSFGFRDSAYYYYPLFEWTTTQWGEGRVPLWNPLDNCGTPIVADSTSSIFYPGKLIFALPAAFYWRFKLYILLHIGLAAVAAFFVARRWRASWHAAAICAMSYAFGGYVLFQHCNVVFLVSAAWLPFAVFFADRMLVKRSIRSAVAFGGTLALMVLGGDPQTAYHAGLVASLYALMLWRRERKVVKAAKHETTPAHRGFAHALARSRPVLLTCAASVGGLLAAVQILPSMQWSQRSHRAMYERPRNIYEAAVFLSDGDAGDEASGKGQEARRGLLDRPLPDTHHDHIYQFSTGPWRLTETVWPNVSGKMYPANRRWTNVIPAEDRIWTPSLYVGLLPLLLGLSALRFRRSKVRERWLSWCVVLSTIGSFGWYGLGWLMQEFQVGLLNADPDAASIGEPVGGLYWLMVVFLPGYAYFRFPAKLLVIASLALSLLAARGWDRAMLRPSKCINLALTSLASISAFGLIFLFAGTSYWFSWVSNAPGDDIWGPLDDWGALGDLRFTFATTTLLSLVCLGLLRVRRNNSSPLAKYVPHMLLIIVAADIAIANRWMIATVDDSQVAETAEVAQFISQSNSEIQGGGSSRIYRGNPDRWVPSQWRWNWSKNRIEDNYNWQRSTVFPRHHLSAGLANASATSTIAPMDYLTVIAVSRGHGVQRPDDIAEPNSAMLDALSVEYLLLPDGVSYPGHQPAEEIARDTLPEDFEVWHNPDRFPRCWIVRDVETLPPIETKSPWAIASRTREVLFSDGEMRDLMRTAVVESEGPPLELGNLVASTNANNERCTVVSEEPGRIELDVTLDAPALVVLNDYYYPGWTASIENREGESSEHVDILRTNRIMRGVVLPEGDYRVEFTYQPNGFRIGASVSGLAWLTLGVAVVVFVTLRGRSTRANSGA